MTELSEAQIVEQLRALPGWSYEKGQITRTFTFNNFMEGIYFVGRVAAAAEAANHHPDIDIRYSDVKISTSSHDINGISERDFKLAAEVSGLV